MAQDHGDGFGRVFRRAAAGVDGAGLRAGRGGALVRLGAWGVRCGVMPGSLGSGAGLAGGAWGGGAGAELPDVRRGAALPRAGAGEGCQAEVAAEFGDDVGDRAGADVVVEVGGVEAVVQLGVQRVGAGVFGGGRRALDDVLDLADDAAAGGGAVVGRVRGGLDGFGEAACEEDAAADGAGDAVEGGGEADEGVWGGGGRRGCVLVRGGGGGLCGLGLGCRLAVQEAGEVGADGDQVMQDLAVAACVCGLAGVVLRSGAGWLGGREQKKNIVGGSRSRVVWVSWRWPGRRAAPRLT